MSRDWNTCSFCGRKSEVRPHSPLDDSHLELKHWPLRLCFFCASIQDNIREMIESIKKNDGN